jgi:hypothetical protein
MMSFGPVTGNAATGTPEASASGAAKSPPIDNVTDQVERIQSPNSWAAKRRGIRGRA